MMKFPRATRISPRITYSVAVLAIAALTGHVMQQDDGMMARLDRAAPTKAGADQPAPGLAQAASAQPSIITPPAVLADPAPVKVAAPVLAPPAPDLAPATPDTLATFDPSPEPAPETLVALDSTPEPATLDPSPEPVTAPVVADACAPALSLTPGPAASVVLTLDAPCAAGEAVRINHAGVAFTLRTDPQGALRVDVPALATPAGFLVTLPDAEALSAEVAVPTLADYDRAAASWTEPAAIELHAFEAGAGYGDAGHIWRKAPQGGAGAHGITTLLGDPAIDGAALAEVYTYPDGVRVADGAVRLTLEAEVTAATCAGAIDATMLASTAGRAAMPETVTLYAPGCDAIGDYLVLRDPVRDQRLAQR